jgi:3-hydroxyacyl-[acyl-carrier-protein] dehydratase
MQTGAILLSQFEGEGTPVATRMNDVRFRKIVRPGDTIEIRAELKERLSNAFFMVAKVTVNGKVALRFEFACALTEA